MAGRVSGIYLVAVGVGLIAKFERAETRFPQRGAGRSVIPIAALVRTG